jgi:Xaa-Pro aminopeptidase
MGLEKVRGVDATNIFRKIRMVKSADEIALLRDAAQKNEHAVEKAMTYLFAKDCC